MLSSPAGRSSERAGWNSPGLETPGETPPGGGGACLQGLGRDPQGSLYDYPPAPPEADGLDQRDLGTPGPERPEEDPLRGRGGGSRAASKEKTD